MEFTQMRQFGNFILENIYTGVKDGVLYKILETRSSIYNKKTFCINAKDIKSGKYLLYASLNENTFDNLDDAKEWCESKKWKELKV